ncbi:phage antirepressor KilAC domain-containing protein [Hathewaya histolytica]|uniref:Phage anti-repressor n=1 Tax=Hathewaya histolytica TaxID=1498 RepID=A0A4U9RSB6_HATHI|nr:phage antirepressor KilAC domain-containing protein [Hathewaya histolytica]VTQ93793.1 phage anti-repressor [Hathewaya histolytica]
MDNLKVFNNQQLIPLKENETGEVLVNGRDIYEFLKVQQDFSDWIKKQFQMIGAEENKDFTCFPFKREGNNATLIEYALTLDSAKEICMVAGVAPRTNDETKKLSREARQYFIKVEKAWNSPEMIMKRALEIANKTVENLRLENHEQKKQLEEQKPKVLFAEAVSTSKTSILVGELAKILKQNGVDMGQNKLFKWLRDNGYLVRRTGSDYNMPTQYSMSLGLFEVKQTAITHSDGHISISKTPKITGKGQEYFINKFIKNHYISL